MYSVSEASKHRSAVHLLACQLDLSEDAVSFVEIRELEQRGCSSCRHMIDAAVDDLHGDHTIDTKMWGYLLKFCF